MSTNENVAYIDGSSTGMYGYYLERTDSTFIARDSPKTNNQSEWLALLTLILDLPQGWKGKVYSDSLLVVNQFKGEYKIKNPELKRIYDLSKALCNEKQLNLELSWIPREKNILGKKLECELAKMRKARWDTQTKL